MAEDGAEVYEARGVENPRIVDLVTYDADAREVVLAILERRPWNGGRPQLEEHEEKLNSYFGYVLDGHLGRQYPQYAGLRVRIELRCPEAPGPREQPFFQAAEQYAASEGLRLTVAVTPDPFADRAPWE
ncbi:MAG TPA: DUF6572 domain-containing protein [Thermoanaerobaculia bacterium]|nr:DUF6572 domain-containing protein [Thermoanaerobaculia bacterium]